MLIEVIGQNPNQAHLERLGNGLLVAHARLKKDQDLFVPDWVGVGIRLFVSPALGKGLIRTLSELNDFAKEHSHDLEFVEGTREPTNVDPITLPTLRGKQFKVVITPAVFVVSGVETTLRNGYQNDFRNLAVHDYIDPSEAHCYGFVRPPATDLSHLSMLVFVGGG